MYRAAGRAAARRSTLRHAGRIIPEVQSCLNSCRDAAKILWVFDAAPAKKKTEKAGRTQSVRTAVGEAVRG